MPNPERIENVLLHQEQPFWIPTPQFLSIGYQDDYYLDNGYWGHDNGNFNQCALTSIFGFGGNAFVTVTIRHGTAPPPPPEDVQRSVLTQHNDSMRTGAYLAEKQLTPDLVRRETGLMQLLYSRKVVGKLWAQLLYARQVPTSRGVKNPIIAFTDQNWVYAYDADDKQQLAPNTPPGFGAIWATKLPVPKTAVKSAANTVPGDIMGGNGTPVIDNSRRTLFVVYEITNGHFPPGGDGDGNYDAEFHLAALDLRDGMVLSGRDIIVDGSVKSSTGDDVIFEAKRQIQTAGLLLAPDPVRPGRSIVYVSFASRWHEESINYHGWVIGYDADTLKARLVFCSTPDRQESGEGGGIWQGGAGLAADEAGNIYFNTGNGPGLLGDRSVREKNGLPRAHSALLPLPGEPLGSRNHGNSIVKLTPVRRSMAGQDFYDFDVTAFSAAADDPDHVKAWEDYIQMLDDPASGGGKFIFGHDIDLGGGGVTVIPDSSQLVGGGKTGVLYLMDRTKMDKIESPFAFDNTYEPCPPPGSDDCSRYRDYVSGPHLHGAPTYWKSGLIPGLVGHVFHWSEKDVLKRFSLSPLFKPMLAVTHTGDITAQDMKMPGGLISLSANDNRDGILWITMPWEDRGRILAYDASSAPELPGVHQKLDLLWDTEMDTKLHVPLPSRKNPPTVADGRVIVGFYAGEFRVYGLKRGTPFLAEPHNVPPPALIDPTGQIDDFLGQLSPLKAAVITPPPGQRALSLAAASGALTYEARLAPHATSVEWILVGVNAELRDQSGVNPSLHYGGADAVLATAEQGFTWTAPDGAQMTWSVEKSVKAPEANNAPWVLFRSVPGGAPDVSTGSAQRDLPPGGPLTPVQGAGVLGAVTYVQQLGTAGGAPPRNRARHFGERVDVPFTASYALYVADTDNGNDSSHPN